MSRVKKNTWSETENVLLQEYYYTLSEKALRDILPGRTRREMAAQVVYLTKKNRRFRGQC